MSNLNILIVEGNIREDSEFFIKAAGASAADNLKNLILKIDPSTNTEIINPGHDDETTNALKNMNKYELKYMFEQETLKVENLIDVVGKNAHHIQDLSAELKKKDANIDKLIARLNDKREEVYKLKNIIQSQTQKNLAEYHFPSEVDN